MSRMSNHWEQPISAVIPYLQWAEVSAHELTVWHTGRHNHAAYEMHIILSGSCSLFIQNAELKMQAGQGIIIPPEVFHAPDRVEQPFRRISVAFYPEESLASELLPQQLLFPINEAIRSMGEAIFHELNRNDSLFHKELLSNQFAQLMLQVFRTVKEMSPLPGVTISHPRQTEDMTVIDTFFVKTPPKQRTKENLAQLLHCSQRQVLRKIYTLYGISFQKKLMLSRIDTAQHLLRVTDKNMAEIGMLVGYSDTAAFYKAFKLYTGTTPVKYRKHYK